MKKFWWILFVILVIAAIAIFAFRPSGDKAPVPAQESAASSDVSTSGQSTAPAAEKPQASTAPAQETEAPEEESYVEESEYVEDYTVEIGDDEDYEIG